MERELLRVSEAAHVLGIGRTKCYQLVAAGELPVVRIGRAVRIPRRLLDGWIHEQAANENALHGVPGRHTARQ